MSDVHFILQGKGGVGKSLISSLLFQYLKQKNISVLGIDTDPVNSTLSNYKNLSVKRLEIMNGDDIDTRRFDELVESIILNEENIHIVLITVRQHLFHFVHISKRTKLSISLRIQATKCGYIQ